jgi:hypothetical protein
MTGDIRELLPLYSLGILDADEVKQVDRAVATDPALAAELASFHDAVDALIAPETPSPDVKARLLASVGGGRFERFAQRIAQMYDVTMERGRELLGLIERAASWEVRAPGIGLVHFEGGPAVATADCGFIRIEPKMIFPWHTHVGEEVSIVLAGTLEDNSGRILRPGDELVQQPGPSTPSAPRTKRSSSRRVPSKESRSREYASASPRPVHTGVRWRHEQRCGLAGGGDHPKHRAAHDRDEVRERVVAAGDEDPARHRARPRR